MKNAAFPPPRLPRSWTLVVWSLCALDLLAGGAICGALILIPTSFDPLETIAAGARPWIDAAYAAFAFIGLLVVTALALRLWHSQRFRAVGAGLVALTTLAVAWACVAFYAEYF